MGSCVSVHKDSEAFLRFRLGSGGCSKDRKLFAAPMPEMGKDQKGGDGPVGRLELFHSEPVDSGLGFKCASFGSKDEAFFDSRAWLDSDCEDDFFSVNGDFISSGNSTPNHQISTPRTPRLSKTFIDTFPDTRSEPSPRKKLAELLLETMPNEGARTEQAVDGKAGEKIEVNGKSESPTVADLPPKSLDATQYISGPNTSGSSSERTPNGNSNNGKQKSPKTMHCCLPGVVPSFNLYDSKKQRLSHNDG